MNRQRDALWKWVIIGNSGVGKTSILSRLCNDEFNNTFISTIGIDFKIKKMEFNGKNVTVQIWDTAGQERFATITKSCYRGAIGIILAYDVTSPASFNDVGKWIKDIQINSGENVHRILVGNKCDVSLEARAVSTEEGQAMADRNGMSFMEVSAKSGKNIEQAFVTLAEQILGLGQAIISTSPTTMTTTTTQNGKTSDGSSTMSNNSSSNSTKNNNNNTNSDGSKRSSIFGWMTGSSSSSSNITGTNSTTSTTTATATGMRMTGSGTGTGIVNQSSVHPSVANATNTSSSSSSSSSSTQSNHGQQGLEANVDSDIIRLTTDSPNNTNISNFNNNTIKLHEDHQSESTIVPGKATKSRCCS